LYLLDWDAEPVEVEKALPEIFLVQFWTYINENAHLRECPSLRYILLDTESPNHLCILSDLMQ